MNKQQFLKFNLYTTQPVENGMYTANLQHGLPENNKSNEKSCKFCGDAVIRQKKKNHSNLRGIFYYKLYIGNISPRKP